MIEIYSKAGCGFCEAAKNLLKAKGMEYQEIRVDLEEGRLQEMLDKSNGQRTVPQIFIDSNHVGGFTELRALDQAGKL